MGQTACDMDSTYGDDRKMCCVRAFTNFDGCLLMLVGQNTRTPAQARSRNRNRQHLRVGRATNAVRRAQIGEPEQTAHKSKWVSVLSTPSPESLTGTRTTKFGRPSRHRFSTSCPNYTSSESSSRNPTPPSTTDNRQTALPRTTFNMVLNLHP